MTRREDWSRVLAAAVAIAGIGALVAVGFEQGVSASATAGQAAPSSAMRSVMAGVYTVEQATRGRGHYEKRCVLCHLDRGQGHEAVPDIAGQSLEREGEPEAAPVAGEVFQKKWGGRNAWDLFTTMVSTMPVGSPRSLAQQEYADVLAYIFELNKYPAGRQELTPARDQLDLIAIGR